MPNGGIPMHMILYPRDGDSVIYCQAGEVRIIPRVDWEQDKARATPICTLTAAEGAALAWHLRYWLGETNLKPGYEMHGEVDAEYDF